MKKKITLLLSLVLAVAMGIGGTLAWLTAKTEAVKNTFTVGNINITLTETTTNYKMVPGQTIAKDPKVTVKAGSEACWLFVKIEEGNDLDKFISYTVADDWTALTDVEGVFYREVAASDTDQSFDVIGYESGDPATFIANKVLVKDTVTKDDMDAFDTDKNGTLSDTEKAALPTLTFTAYAVQKDGLTTAANAWGQIPTT
ncbi:SipW-dependent-type signal peptide-containing protein [Intestinimonas massiliensis]|uniref:SipW-dependent-type signal peptide-containing protein n=1 Tax=Intestinimonas massiliensis (ex Afouda et al. 2020) TaxID=1673721 RepID=A0ABS9M8Q6_9FIRM|nr:SipW-dependent-type signal peptide-containing protein [Intestinimonas massiliensis (ex Afouda et al. 2020)]MCG4527141.1 SipW-dependent-type signal peptide-containing protein [Intestinimonas massiliensis (ex Afouda et al. 2020)]MCQ4806321.1 SipW-dependent-type signal peptide-containing protein [Intestinimonas massiliensis (ex Afouda et al. 2020)]